MKANCKGCGILSPRGGLDMPLITPKLTLAYSSNDTGSLKQLLERIRYKKIKADWKLNLDTCIKQPEFKAINAEEKYRFIYSSAFCLAKKINVLQVCWLTKTMTQKN